MARMVGTSLPDAGGVGNGREKPTKMLGELSRRNTALIRGK